MIKPYKFTGDVFICNYLGGKIQITVIDLIDKMELLPVMSSNHKYWVTFMNNRNSINQKDGGFYFTGELVKASYSNYFKNIKIYDTNEFLDKYVELLI